MRRYHPGDDHRWTPTRAEQLAGTFFEFPVAPPAVGTEQRSLTEERFHRWAETADGAACLDWIEQEALARQHERRIGVKALVEACRDALHRQINNTHTRAIGVWLVDRHAVLRDRIELRERK